MRTLKTTIKALLVAALLLPVVYGQSTDPPTLINQPGSQTLATGSTLFFLVLANGAPPISYQWYHNFVPTTTSAMLMVSNVQPADAGFYFLRASNLFGAVISAVASVIVTNQVPVVVTNSAISVKLEWDPNSEVDLAGYKVFYYKDGATNQVTNVDVGNKTNVTISLTSPVTTYHFYATAYNSSGLQSGPSSEVLDLTPDYQPSQVTGVNSVLK